MYLVLLSPPSSLPSPPPAPFSRPSSKQLSCRTQSWLLLHAGPQDVNILCLEGSIAEREVVAGSHELGQDYEHVTASTAGRARAAARRTRAAEGPLRALSASRERTPDSSQRWRGFVSTRHFGHRATWGSLNFSAVPCPPLVRGDGARALLGGSEQGGSLIDKEALELRSVKSGISLQRAFV